MTRRRHANLLADKLNPEEHNDIVLCHLIADNLAVAITHLTLDVMRFDNTDIETGVRNRIYGGTRERRDREALFDAIAKIAPNAGLSVEPPFFRGLCEVVARFINASAPASQVVRCLDHLTRQRVIPGYSKSAGEVANLFGDRTLKLARDILHFISSEGHIPLEMFKESLS